MSTRSSIFYHHNPDTGVTIHIYDEVMYGSPEDIRLEIEFEHGAVNVPWPKGIPKEELAKLSI